MVSRSFKIAISYIKTLYEAMDKSNQGSRVEIENLNNTLIGIRIDKYELPRTMVNYIIYLCRHLLFI